jgi:hypothetical protein
MALPGIYPAPPQLPFYVNNKMKQCRIMPRHRENWKMRANEEGRIGTALTTGRRPPICFLYKKSKKKNKKY